MFVSVIPCNTSNIAPNRKKGWEYKRGTGLIDFYYLPPGGNIHGEENVDYFTSTQRIMEHLKVKTKSPIQSRTRRKSSKAQANEKESKPSAASKVKSTRNAAKINEAQDDKTIAEESVASTLYSYYAETPEINQPIKGVIQPNDSWKSVWDNLK